MSSREAPPLFARLLGDAWRRLLPAISQMHTVSSQRWSEGRCTVARGSGVLGNCIAALMGLPQAADDLPISVHFRREGDLEHWTRSFGAQVFYSTMRAGQGRSKGLLCERVGCVDFAQELLLEGDRLRLLPRRWSLFSIPLPLWLGPRSNSFETERDGRFCFHVEISHPFTGPIVRYVGWLVAAEPPCE